MFMFENAGATQARASGEPTKAALARRLALIAAASVTPTVAFAEDAPEPRRGGVIEYGHEQEPPCLSGGWVQQWYLQRQFSDNLVSRTDAGGVAPWLATDWTLSDDRLTYTFGLKPNVFFTDGAPLDGGTIGRKLLNARDNRLELSARTESRHRGGLDLHRLAGARVARHTGSAAALLEDTEAGDRDAVALVHRADDGVHNVLHRGGSLPTIGAQFGCEYVDELRFVHSKPPKPVVLLGPTRGHGKPCDH